MTSINEKSYEKLSLALNKLAKETLRSQQSNCIDSLMKDDIFTVKVREKFSNWSKDNEQKTHFTNALGKEWAILLAAEETILNDKNEDQFEELEESSESLGELLDSIFEKNRQQEEQTKRALLELAFYDSKECNKENHDLSKKKNHKKNKSSSKLKKTTSSRRLTDHILPASVDDSKTRSLRHLKMKNKQISKDIHSLKKAYKNYSTKFQVEIEDESIKNELAEIKIKSKELKKLSRSINNL